MHSIWTQPLLYNSGTVHKLQEETWKVVFGLASSPPASFCIVQSVLE